MHIYICVYTLLILQKFSYYNVTFRPNCGKTVGFVQIPRFVIIYAKTSFLKVRHAVQKGLRDNSARTCVQKNKIHNMKYLNRGQNSLAFSQALLSGAGI
jgi:hypothetical protein